MLAKLKPPVANNVHETPLRNYTASPRESRADRQSNDDQSRSNITESIKPKRHETDGQQLMSINTEVSNLPHYSTLSLRQENENCAPRNCQKDDTKSIDTQDFSEV
ncbi:hypothetical protein DPMN_110156 [Dreissena polymorpha]|uniref:Uncharacterized protein n=2 Tax=Dreissena polymorpha TaxID=45954 RepID=A0A9D4KBX0_DREPO|nr:hypothetical protein DPMN_110156 [Dreissena polymorpha]